MNFKNFKGLKEWARIIKNGKEFIQNKTMGSGCVN